MFKRILVPIDGSRTSNSGLNTAIRMARDAKAELILLHVVDENVLALSGEYAGAAYMDRLMADMREGGRKVIAAAAATARKQGVTAKTVLMESVGPAALPTSSYSRRKNCGQMRSSSVRTDGAVSAAWSWAAMPRRSCADHPCPWCSCVRKRAGGNDRRGRRLQGTRGLPKLTKGEIADLVAYLNASYYRL